MGLAFVRIVSSPSNHNPTDKASVHPGIVFQIPMPYFSAAICRDTLRISLENSTLQNTSYFVIEERNRQVQKVVISSIRFDRANLCYLIPYLRSWKQCDNLMLSQLFKYLTYIDILSNNPCQEDIFISFTYLKCNHACMNLNPETANSMQDWPFL
jgi:hypothetical protein